jgi:hypothetical protein
MPPHLLASIDANARNKIAFTLDTADAAAVAKGSALSPEDFSQLPQFEIYASLLNEGRQTGWFSGKTLPPPKQISDPEGVVAESQARYGMEPRAAEPQPSPETAEPGITDVDNEPFGRTPRGAS